MIFQNETNMYVKYLVSLSSLFTRANILTKPVRTTEPPPKKKKKKLMFDIRAVHVELNNKERIYRYCFAWKRNSPTNRRIRVSRKVV